MEYVPSLKWLQAVNISHVLVLGLVVKAIVSDVSYASFLLTIPVLSYEAYKMYLAARAPTAIKMDAELLKEIDNIKSKLNAQTLEKGIKPSSVPRW